MTHRCPSEKSYSFFSRMLLICTALLAAFSILASMIVARLSFQYEQAQYLKSYDLAAMNLSETFASRYADFQVLAGKFLSNGQCDPRLCELLEAPSYEDVPPATRNYCIRLLADICLDDRYLRGFLILSPAQGQLYCYTDSRSYLSYTSGLEGLPLPTPFSGEALDLDTVSRLLTACGAGDGRHNAFYGMTATLYRSPSTPLGYLIPLYSATEYTDILANFSLGQQNIFTITDDMGHLFFHSAPSLDLEASSCYTGSFHNRQYGFQVTYYTARRGLPVSSITYLIILFALVVTLFSFGLYYITYYLSHRNISRILEGMKHFSVDDLTYRIVKPSGRNEFTQIIDGFNAMCEELQRNVERSYVYELQQKKSELYALQTSINPHFLYNTLEIIRTQVINNRPADASQMILLLSKIYRTQINSNIFVTLEEEVELCENLMILYQYRFQNFDYEFDMEERVSRYALPKNTLQPLIENYFVHGIVAERRDNLFTLSIHSCQDQGKSYVRLQLANNGNPISPQRLQALKKNLADGPYADKDAVGFALTNVNTRLRIVFHDDCSMQIGNGQGDIRFQVELLFPAITVEEMKDSFA